MMDATGVRRKRVSQACAIRDPSCDARVMGVTSCDTALKFNEERTRPDRRNETANRRRSPGLDPFGQRAQSGDAVSSLVRFSGRSEFSQAWRKTWGDSAQSDVGVMPHPAQQRRPHQRAQEATRATNLPGRRRPSLRPRLEVGSRINNLRNANPRRAPTPAHRGKIQWLRLVNRSFSRASSRVTKI